MCQRRRVHIHQTCVMVHIQFSWHVVNNLKHRVPGASRDDTTSNIWLLHSRVHVIPLECKVCHAQMKGILLQTRLSITTLRSLETGKKVSGDMN